MNTTKLLRLLFLLLPLSFQYNAQANSKVVGYLPAYKGLLENTKTDQLKQLTHLNIAFLNPDKSGSFIHKNQFTCTYTKLQQLLTKKELLATIRLAQQENVLVSFSLGGAIIPQCGGDWRALLVPDKQQLIVDNLLALVDEFNLNGIDIDLESQLLMSVISDQNFLPVIQALSKALKARGKILSAATGSYIGGMMPVETLAYFDYVSLMSYDAIGPTWGTAGVEHATLKQSEQDIKLWLERGLTPEQLVLGLPFYGYGFGKYKATYTFAQIINEFGKASAEHNLIGNACAECDYVTYNGTVVLRTKIDLALTYGSGVMIWEISQDSDQLSLLTIINQHLNQVTKTNLTKL